MAKSAQFDSEAFVGRKPDMAPSMAHHALGEDGRGSSSSLNKRNMVLDEDRFAEQFLKCNICKGKFSSICLPRMLLCHHSFCRSCIDNIFAQAKEQKMALPPSARIMPPSAPPGAVYMNCPVCRSTSVVTEETIKKLPTDHRIVQLMDFVHHTDHCTVTFCSKHKLQPLNFFCDLCIQPVCRDCTVLDHKEADGHLVIDLEDAMATYTPILDNTIIELEAESICLDEKIIALKSVTSNIDKVKIDLLGQVRSCMTRVRELLNEREKTLLAKVHQETEKERSKLTEKSEQLENRRRDLVDKTSKLKQAKENSMLEEMFRIHQGIRECRAEPKLRVREVDDGLMTTFVLNTRDETMLTSRINNFGDVMSKVEATSSRIKPKVKNFLYRSSSFR